MSKTDDNAPQLPEGYEHVEVRLNETLHKVEQIDNQLKNIPKERGPKPQYNPPHYVGGLVPGQRDKMRIALEEKQYQLKMDTLSKTEVDTSESMGQDGRVVRDTVREKLFPNPYRQMSLQDLEQERHTVKEIEQSQDYMDAKLVERAAQRNTMPQPDKPVTSKLDKSEMSARFSMSLAFTKATDKNGGPADKARGRDIEPDKN
ncbi:hypothetical protein [Spirosoma sordidisoli]|uniref:Uncharacterized protein n=1 Tax=Spirosoma sordidisoli TaxID=2502893 RepID=A0A4Q2UCS5_9BACT|nr:hypothetical protein [Spirosoma sordidisoli]RYC66943.1 hypothetical protein EQG79_26560 [Spirosoma sordidisoli]